MTEPVKNDKKAGEKKQKFTKRQILASSRYAERKDLAAAVLDDQEQYDFETADSMIEKYMKGQVK